MMLVMWYLEVRVSRSDSEASSYARGILALLLDPMIRSGTLHKWKWLLASTRHGLWFVVRGGQEE